MGHVWWWVSGNRVWYDSLLLTWFYVSATVRLTGVVALSAGHRTCDLQAAGSNTERALPRSGLRQPTYTCVPL